MKTNKLLIITGDLATGKSRFVKILKDRFNITCFEKDIYKEKLAINYKEITKEISSKLSSEAKECLYNELIKASKDNTPILLEANFHENDYKRLYELSNELKYEMLTIYLKGDPSILFERFVNRLETSRNKVHAVSNLYDYNCFKEYTLKSQSEHIFGNYIIIDANNFNYQTDDKLLDAIKGFLNK